MVDTESLSHKSASKKQTPIGRGRLRPQDIGLSSLDSDSDDKAYLMESEVGLLSDEEEEEVFGNETPQKVSKIPIHSYSIPQGALFDSDEDEENGNDPPESQTPENMPVPATTFKVTAASANNRSQPSFMVDDIDEGPSRAEGQNNHLVLMTFVGRCKGVRNVKKSLSNTFKQAEEIMPSGGEMFNICENFDTYQKGGLYPLLHVCHNPKVVEKVKESEHFLEADALGNELVVDQALFKEASTIDIPGSEADDYVLTVAAFRSIEPSPNAKLLKHWKSWTGARAYFKAMLTAGLDCQKISFLVRDSPLMEDEQDFAGFYYLLVCQVGIREPSDEGLIVDVLQRFRVERWFGYQTIYRHYRH